MPSLLKALAKLTFDFFFGKNKEWVSEENQIKLFEGITEFGFSHSNPMWRYYSMTSDEIRRCNLESLKEYLPEESDSNHDLGNYDSNNEFRFGAKHNDIFPIIGDMIRWKLNLPKRKREVEATQGVMAID